MHGGVVRSGFVRPGQSVVGGFGELADLPVKEVGRAKKRWRTRGRGKSQPEQRGLKGQGHGEKPVTGRVAALVRAAFASCPTVDPPDFTLQKLLEGLDFIATISCILPDVGLLGEIVAGIAFGSMDLLADGLHMASHAAALSITALAYWMARRHAANP